MRLDVYLVEKGIFSTRNKAQTAVKDSAVSINGKIILKPNYDVSDNDIVEIIKEANPYVSRGGFKLEKAISEFRLDFKDKVVLDIGSSTGGFTDCALQHGAKLVYSVDVGKDQLDQSLRDRTDVVVMEQTNILDVMELHQSIDYIVMDVSFVSIQVVLPAVDRFLNDDNAFVCLIKPQFEVGKVHMKNGVVKDKNIHMKVIQNVSDALSTYNMGISKLIPSPILGGSGNKEFLAYIRRNIKSNINIKEVCK